uniref:DOMON domain-containing protein n=1 Tax=Panagrellus redivivus TaxID=6233 RepID=A0A7E4V204_PANRE
MHLFLLNFVLLGISSQHIMAAGSSFCTTTVGCIEKIKRIVPETNRFWFGDQFKLQCGTLGSPRYRGNNAVNCINPPELSNYYSMGSRLFRVKTFTSAYLQNLSIYPRITYKPENGTYRACDHDFDETPEVSEVEGHPDMIPVDPFYIRNPPDISWPERSGNDSLIIAMVDVGFGQLRFLSINFPRNTQVIRKYSPVDNFRFGMPTPMALLVFRPAPGAVFTPKSFRSTSDEKFDLTEFMIKHNLENGLIGLNWIMVGTDAYGIEQHKMKWLVDNCHSLLQTKLLKDQRWEFVDTFPLNEMDSTLTVSFNQPEVHQDVCCSKIELAEEEIFTDALADKQIPSIAVRTPPKVTSLRQPENADNYQRTLRHYLVTKEDKFTMVMFDPKKQYLYWMVADLSSDSLATGSMSDDAYTVSKYKFPVPGKPNECQYVVLMLFRQPRSTGSSDISEYYNSDHPLRSSVCDAHCVYRSLFSIEQFKSFHRLSLASATWFKVCYDVYEAARQIQRIAASNVTTSTTAPTIIKKQHGREIKPESDQKNKEMALICSLIKQTNLDCAKLSNAPAYSHSLTSAILIPAIIYAIVF